MSSLFMFILGDKDGAFLGLSSGYGIHYQVVRLLGRNQGVLGGKGDWEEAGKPCPVQRERSKEHRGLWRRRSVLRDWPAPEPRISSAGVEQFLEAPLHRHGHPQASW